MPLFVNNVNEKNITEIQDRRNFESVRAICTRVTTLHLCFMRIYSFSANHKCVFFFGYFITLINTPTGINSAHENCLPSKDGEIKNSIWRQEGRGGVGGLKKQRASLATRPFQTNYRRVSL